MEKVCCAVEDGDGGGGGEAECGWCCSWNVLETNVCQIVENVKKCVKILIAYYHVDNIG